jgi:hypothetical protein
MHDGRSGGDRVSAHDAVVRIAHTARSIDASVVCANLDDFVAIRRIERFEVICPRTRYFEDFAFLDNSEA